MTQNAGPAAGRAIFFSGPIGAGKTSLGRAVATKLGAAFLDGDDFSRHDRPWYGSSLSTTRGIADAVQAAFARRRLVIVAYPLRCVSHVYFQRRLTDRGHTAIFVTLRASAAAIVHASRGRSFSADETARISQMVAEGYAGRPFSDLIVDTDRAGFDETVDAIVRQLGPLLGR